MKKKYAFNSYTWQLAAEIEQMSDNELTLWLVKTAVKGKQKK